MYIPRNWRLGIVVIITKNIYIKCGLVFGFKFYVIGFINVYREQIYSEPFICAIKSSDHISLKIFWIRNIFTTTLVSSVNSIGTVLSFTVLGRSLMYTRNSNGSKTDPWGASSDVFFVCRKNCLIYFFVWILKSHISVIKVWLKPWFSFAINTIKL